MSSLSSILSVPTRSTSSLAASVTSLAATALSSTLAAATSSALSIPTSLNNGSGTENTDSSSETTSDKGKIVGLSLAIGSGLLIGSSFVFKKKGLINCTKNGMLAGEGHAYLKSTMWWSGMLMMVVGEVFNFVAYAFVQPILVTPLGALSVVICAILSSIFLRERLSMQGKVGCAQCIVGATIIVLHAPEQTAVKTIQEFKHFMIQPIFLTWMVLIIGSSLALIFKAGPKWGKDHMMVYIGVCSLIGSLSVVSTQGLGAAIVHNISTGESQFDNWFIYFVIVFMVVTLLTEINYLNKALNLFNTAMVTPTYYVTFTSTTIITSAILYQGFAASVVSILTVCLGFLVICGGVLLLQTSKPVVPLHIPGSSTAGIVVGTITYDDIEPTAADMRASPFSSIRRITRDFSTSNRPSSSVVGHSSVFQSSPLNPRAESLLQRKRRASNAAAQQAQANGHLRSRPASMISNTGLLAVPSGPLGVPSTSSISSAAVASASGIATATAGITSAFYPSATGPYSTMVLGPNGAQIRLQLCEIVVSDEKNETNRYQVYRPVPEDQLLPLPHPQSLLSHRSHSSSMAVPAGGGSVFAALNQYNSLSYKQQHPLVAPRGSFLTDSRSSSIRFQDPSTRRPSVEEMAAVSAGGENDKDTPLSNPSKGASPISGSLFVPPKLSILPPTPSPSSTASSNSATATVTSSTPTSPTSTAPTTGPLAPGGSFFARPPNRFRSPSSASARTTATTGTNGGGDIMEINDAGHLGRPVLVSIEPVQQQPLYSLYVPPPSVSTLTTTTTHPHLNKKSHPPLSPSAAMAAANALHSSNVATSSPLDPGDDSSRSDGNDDDDDDDDDDSDDKENGDGDANATASDLLQPSHQDAQKEADDEDGRRVLPEGKPKRKNVFLRLFQRPPSSSSSTSHSPATSSSPSVTASVNRNTNGTRTAGRQQQPALSHGPSPPIPFHRTNHPTTRISEGEEEEDPEDMNLKK